MSGPYIPRLPRRNTVPHIGKSYTESNPRGRSFPAPHANRKEATLKIEQQDIDGLANSVGAATVPLCVDLDGTLVKSDTFHDALCILLRTRPASFFRIPGWWIAGGKAHVKSEVAKSAPLDAEHLPYNQAVLHFLLEQHRLGRPIYLATGADASLANRVAAHLALFTGVLASDGSVKSVNLTGNHKLAALQHRFPVFDYIGNANPDLPALCHSRLAYLANPTAGLRVALKARNLSIAQSFEDRKPLLPTLIKAIRAHQWAKNVLLFLPLLLSHALTMRAVVACVAAFFCFSFIASANYLINDLLDIDSDRRHLKKRFRPFAAGDLSVASGLRLVLLLVAASCALLPRLPLSFAMWLLVYAATTSAYSFYLKRVPLVDVLVLSGLYTLRMLAGGAATDTFISPWLSSLAIFLFLSLAMVKRFSELSNLRERGATNSHGRGYLVSDLEQIRAFGTASAYASVVVFSLYISRPDVYDLYRHSGRLWLIVPLMLYWLNRVWLLASRGDLDEDPVVFALRDRVSLALAAATALLAIFATL
jgi:4-hydroxybenzoate polyprenyltransferase